MWSEGVLFPDSLSKPVAVRFDTEAMTSDGGAVLLGSLDRGLGLTRAVLTVFQDDRVPARVVHSQLDMLRQRVYGLGLGYEDRARPRAPLATSPDWAPARAGSHSSRAALQDGRPSGGVGSSLRPPLSA